MQVVRLHKKFDALQKTHGHGELASIYGAGCIRRPKLMLVFMNPTGKNIASNTFWHGLRAPWLGTKNVWKLLYKIGVLTKESFSATQTKKASEWTPAFCLSLYGELVTQGIYITNLAKCTQLDARPLPNTVFHQYLELLQQEISFVNPKKIVTFGNQVSSIIVGKSISVGSYIASQHENVKVGGQVFPVYPTWYPVGQGIRNLPLAAKRIKKVASSKS